MLRITTSPPQRAIDDPPMVVVLHDPAWDFKRIVDEQARLTQGAHPWTLWRAGETGYSLEAPLTVPEAIRGDGPATVTIKHWLRPGALPTMFEVRPLTAIEYETANYRPEIAALEICRRAIVRVHNVDDGSGNPATIEPPRERGLITLEWMDALSRAQRDAIGEIAGAVERLGQGVDGLGKP